MNNIYAKIMHVQWHIIHRYMYIQTYTLFDFERHVCACIVYWLAGKHLSYEYAFERGCARLCATPCREKVNGRRAAQAHTPRCDQIMRAPVHNMTGLQYATTRLV